MKKLALVLIVLLALSGVAFADVTVGGEFDFGVIDFGADVSSAVGKAEININASVDDFTTVAVELDSEGSVVDGDWGTGNVDLEVFSVTSDITGALGVDAVSLSLTAGLFKAFYTNWNYVSRSGEEFYYSGLAGGYLWTTLTKPEFAVAANVGIAGFNLKYWQDLDGDAMTVAFSGAPLEGLNFLVGYHANFATVAAGSLWLDAGFSFEAGPASVTIPASLVVDLGATTENLGWSSGVAADIDAFHVAVGVGGAGADMFKDINVEVSTSIVENADIYVIGDLDASTTGVFQSVDLGASYKFGAFKLGAGYVVAMDEANSTILVGDTYSMTGSGLYLFGSVDY